MSPGNCVPKSLVDTFCKRYRELQNVNLYSTFTILLIPDGSTVQIDLGDTSNAVAYGLEGKKDLGVHTEMFTDSIIYLAKKGVINGSEILEKRLFIN